MDRHIFDHYKLSQLFKTLLLLALHWINYKRLPTFTYTMSCCCCCPNLLCKLKLWLEFWSTLALKGASTVTTAATTRSSQANTQTLNYWRKLLAKYSFTYVPSAHDLINLNHKFLHKFFDLLHTLTIFPQRSTIWSF